MKHLFWIGLAIVLLGLTCFFIQVPQTQRQSLKNTGSISVGVNNVQQKDLSPWVGGVLIIGGLVMMVGGCRERNS
jgi:uncharacterized membrane protein